jgi:hypothetical protein
MNRLERALEHYRVHVLVYGFTLNDIEGAAYRSSGASEHLASWLRWAQRQSGSGTCA